MLVIIFLLSGTLSSADAASTLVIRGVDGDLEQNIRLLVGQPPEREDERRFARYIDGLPQQVVTALSAYGYYAAEATVNVAEVPAPAPQNAAERALDRVGEVVTGRETDRPAGDVANASTVTQITINVERNQPVRIRNIDVQITDIDSDNIDFDEVLSTARARLAEGKVFVSSDYESAKSSLLTTAQELGYFDFEFTRTEVRVSRRERTADIAITAEAGQRFTFGDILFRQRTFSDSFMNRWVPFAEGDPYQASLIGQLTQNLQSSGYFSSVRVRPLIDPRYGEVVPVTVDLTERDQNQVAIGVGYSSDTEFRSKLTWGKPLLNSRGHSAEWGLSVARFRQSANFSYRIPRENQPLFNYWGIDFGLQNQTDLDSLTSTLNFQRVRRTSSDWSESLFLRWERERFEVDDDTQTTDLVMPGASYSRNRSRGEPFATWGQSTSFLLMGGSKNALSTIDFLKGLVRFRTLRAVSERNTLIGTVEFGAISSNDYARVPITQRFFAGGDRTVRGFAFRDISPRNAEGEPIGGRFLEVANLEYNYRFRDRWSGAVFTDAGRAYNDSDAGYSVGVGVGVRWQSPVGPFRIDLARPISDNDGSDFRIHLSLGPDL